MFLWCINWQSTSICVSCWQHLVHWATICTGFAGIIHTALNENRMNALLICNDCASNGTRDKILSCGARSLVQTALKPDVGTIRHTPKQLNETAVSFRKCYAHVNLLLSHVSNGIMRKIKISYEMKPSLRSFLLITNITWELNRWKLIFIKHAFL